MNSASHSTPLLLIRNWDVWISTKSWGLAGKVLANLSPRRWSLCNLELLRPFDMSALVCENDTAEVTKTKEGFGDMCVRMEIPRDRGLPTPVNLKKHFYCRC